MKFTTVDSAQGLSQGSVLSIAQDSRGFMWFGTDEGLYRYDGYELKHLIHERADDHSLPNDWVSALVRTASGKVWVASDGGGLVSIGDNLGAFTRAELETCKPIVGSNDKIRALHEDRHGRLWVATRDAGVYALDLERHTMVAYRHTTENSISDDSVFAITEDAAGLMWIGTASGLDRCEFSL